MIPESLTFSPDGSRFSYVAKVPAGHLVVIDGQASDVHQAIGYIQFSPGGQHAIYSVIDGLTHQAFLDGKPGPKYHGIYPESLQVTDEGTAVYLAIKGDSLVRIRHAAGR